jgi:hypothetical protein
MPRLTALQRSDPAAVRLMVDSIFEGISGGAKQSYCEFLAASIDYLSQHHGDRWGVTLREDTNVLRLNAGIVEALVLYSGGLRVLVEKKKAPPRTRFDRRSHHRNAPGCETADIPLAELPRSLPRLAEAHHAALTIIARRPAFRKTLNAHSTGVTAWLSQVLRRKVANPEIPQRPLHIVQGGIQNGDKALLERLARGNQSTRSWVAPKSVAPGDEIVVYIRGFGLFATALAKSSAEPRAGWKNRYGSDLTSIRLIEPPVSLAAIRRHIPDLDWAKYPRSITTPPPELADGIRTLIAWRRTGGIELDEDFVDTANIDELKMIALHVARERVPPKAGTALYRAGSAAIRRYVLGRAKGLCEGCGVPAPFRGVDGQPFLEAHHTTRLADDGPDHPRKVIGICPNCHRRAHLAEDAKSFNTALMKKLRILEAAL